MTLTSYTEGYREGFRTAYILGPAVALKQIQAWEQAALDAKELEKDYRDAEAHETPNGEADKTAESEDENKVG